MEIQDRIKLIMKTHSLNASQFADQITVQRSSISHILSGRNKPSLDFVQKILQYFPRVNADWLLTGKTKSTEMEQEDLILGEATAKNQTEKNKSLTSSFNIQQQSQSKKKESTNLQKQVKRVVVFYNDGTCDAFLANEQ
jgi:transcriptional regulator with XRE-family HTH domain